MKHRAAYDVGVVGVHGVPNFGGALTYYALYKTLAAMGLSPLMIERPFCAPHHPLSHTALFHSPPYPPNAIAPYYPTKGVMRSELNNRCDSFLVGSDQLFNGDLYHKFGRWSALDWVHNGHKKIAYAASFGHHRLFGGATIQAELAYFLKRFDAFSVREQSAVAFARRKYGIKAPCVLDPVFLCGNDVFIQLAEQAPKKHSGPYIGAYILDPNPNKKNFLDRLAAHYDLPMDLYTDMVCSPSTSLRRWGHNVNQGKVEDRLASIINCSYFVTDSFHGMCLGVIFEKPVIVFANEARGLPRFHSIADLLGLADLLRNPNPAHQEHEMSFPTISYEKVRRKLRSAIAHSKDWLRAALGRPIPRRRELSDFDIMMHAIDEQNRRIDATVTAQAILNANLSLSRGGETGTPLSYITDPEKYFAALHVNLIHYIILIAVCDTPRITPEPCFMEGFANLGLSADFSGEHAREFVACIDSGKVALERIGESGAPAECALKIEKDRFFLGSNPSAEGDATRIYVNGVASGTGRKGINIVVIDKRIPGIVDSVCFSAHESELSCHRLNDVSECP